MSTAFLNKVYDVYENRDYFGIGCDNLNPVREVKSSQSKPISEDEVLKAVKVRLERVKKTVNKLKLEVEDNIDPSDNVVSMDVRGDRLPVNLGISPKEASIRAKIGTPIDASTIFGDMLGDSIDGGEADALEREIQGQMVTIMAIAGASANQSFSNVSSPFTVDCDGIATEITGDEDDDDSNSGKGKKKTGAEDNEDDGSSGDDDDNNEGDGDLDLEIEEAAAKQDTKDAEDEADAQDAILQCALKELAFLRIILMILNIVKILRRICAYVISTVYIVMDVVQLAAGAWLNPTNIAKIANKIIQRVLASVVMIIFQVIQKLWNMLNLNCISDMTQDLIDQIKTALSALESLKSLCDPNSISFSPSEIIQSLQASIEEAVNAAAEDMKAYDMKQAGQEITNQLKKTSMSIADAVKKSATGQALKAYKESKEMFERAKKLLGKGGPGKNVASASANLGLSDTAVI